MKKLLSILALLVITSVVSTAAENEQQVAYNDFMTKLKACTPATAELFDGKHEVLGFVDGNCAYNVEYKTNITYSCKIPTPVAEMFGYQSIVSLRTGEKSTFVESILNNRNYCQQR